MSRQSTIPPAHRQGCGHCGSALHSELVPSTRSEHLNWCPWKCRHNFSFSIKHFPLKTKWLSTCAFIVTFFYASIFVWDLPSPFIWTYFIINIKKNYFTCKSTRFNSFRELGAEHRVCWPSRGWLFKYCESQDRWQSQLNELSVSLRVRSRLKPENVSFPSVVSLLLFKVLQTTLQQLTCLSQNLYALNI